MAALGPFGLFFEGLATPGDAAQAATDIIAAEGLFRFGIISLFAVIALDVIVACALYHVFRPVNTGLSLLAASFRLVYSGIFMVATSQLLGVLDLLGSNDSAAVLSAGQLHAHAQLRMEMFSTIWTAGFVLFGLHLLVIGVLAYRSGYVPRFLGALVVIAGVGYVFDSVAGVVSSSPAIEPGYVTWVGELLLAFWLVIRGRRVTLTASH